MNTYTDEELTYTYSGNSNKLKHGRIYVSVKYNNSNIEFEFQKTTHFNEIVKSSNRTYISHFFVDKNLTESSARKFYRVLYGCSFTLTTARALYSDGAGFYPISQTHVYCSYSWK